MNLKYYLFIVLCLLMTACKTPKDVVYLQGIDKLTTEQLNAVEQSYTLRIVKDDLLSISVSAWDPTAVTPFNPPVYAYAATQGEQPVTPSETLYTYLVDQEGNINFPVLGKIHVLGLTRLELADKLEKMIAEYVEGPLVNVQLLNFRITMMGDVARPGTFTIKNDRLSILEAIGLCGDLQLTANRKNILVIRDTNGKRETFRVDITDPEVFNSPAFYLKQNDIVYVEPIDSKIRTRSSSTRNISVISSVMSTLSLVASMIFSIITLTRNNSN